MPVPLPVIANTYRCALRWSHSSGQTAVNVMHIYDVVNAAGAAAVMETLDDNVTAAMFPNVSAGASVIGVDITPLDGTSATQTFLPATPSHWTGGTGGDMVPAVSTVVKLQTALRGRANRGRLFLPFIAESSITNGKISDGTEVTGTAAWQAFQAALQADADGPFHVVVASYDRKHAGAGAHATAVTALTMEQVLATQRRRQGRLRGA